MSKTSLATEVKRCIEGGVFPQRPEKKPQTPLQQRAKDQLCGLRYLVFNSPEAVKMMGSYIVLILFAFLVEGVFGEVMSVMKGNRVTLNTGVTKKSVNDTLLWYFDDTLIAQINDHPEKSCLYYGKDVIFKDRLEVDYKTGSLTITISRPEHTGRYEAELIKYDNTSKTKTFKTNPKCNQTKINQKRSDLVIHKSFSLTVSDLSSGEKLCLSLAVPDSGLSPGAVAGIVVGVVLLVAAVVGVICVMIYRRRSSRNDIKKNKQNMPDQVSDEKLMISEEHNSAKQNT